MQNMDKAMDHLKHHQTYPASRADLVKECENLSDFSDDDKKWFMDNLPSGNYKSADEVIKVLGWDRKQEMPQEHDVSAMM